MSAREKGGIVACTINRVKNTWTSTEDWWGKEDGVVEFLKNIKCMIIQNISKFDAKTAKRNKKRCIFDWRRASLRLRNLWQQSGSYRIWCGNSRLLRTTHDPSKITSFLGNIISNIFSYAIFKLNINWFSVC